MNKKDFINDLKKSLIHHYQEIKKENIELLSYGIYTDGDASTIGIYYNTQEHLAHSLQEAKARYSEADIEPLDYVFFMEEWKKDISLAINEALLDELNNRVDKYGSEEYEKGKEDYKDEILDFFTQALLAFKQEVNLENERSDFFLHLEVSDSWIDKKMLNRIASLQTTSRFLEYKKYAELNNG